MSSTNLLLLYRSIAREADFDPSDLDILRTALRFNQAHGIKGFLCRCDGQFVQVLHGPEQTVLDLMARIRADDRHKEVEVIHEDRGVDTSPFMDWSMGYDSFTLPACGIRHLPDGSVEPVNPEAAASVLAAMIDLAREARSYGSAFPYARQPGETDDAYLSRLGASMAGV